MERGGRSFDVQWNVEDNHVKGALKERRRSVERASKEHQRNVLHVPSKKNLLFSYRLNVEGTSKERRRNVKGTSFDVV
jgi:hypothetical protein